MSLLKGFPEVEEFFKRQVITEKELKKFKNDIKNKYQNIVIQKSALTLIKLNLIKFENRIVENNTKNIIDQANEKNEKKLDPEEVKKKLIVNYKENDIKSIGEILDISSELIIHILKQNNIKKSRNEFLTFKEYEILEDFFQSKSDALKRKTLQNARTLKSRRKKVNRSLNKNQSVYDKIKNQNGLGKVIYIRKK